MATVTRTNSAPGLAEVNQRVRSPLARLRGYIRTYVGLEGAAVCALFLAGWFWFDLALDYGLFKGLGVDWVQDWPLGFRVVVLGLLAALLAAAVTFKVFTRLFREFSDPALALVLERRFPALLGDRLITAVELSDPAKAATYGYSAAMVRATIDDAAGRVDQLPLKEVFDWKRLRRQGLAVVGLALGVYLLVAGGVVAGNGIGTGAVDVAGGFGDFHEVAGLWFERNVLLKDTLWPRRAWLEVLGWEPGETRKIGLGSTAPTLRARAIKYVVAGAPTPETVAAYRTWLEETDEPADQIESRVAAFAAKPALGWRALTWFDLSPALLGEEVPEVAIPSEWTPRDRATGLMVDEIELRLDRPETHKTLAAQDQEALRRVLERLDQQAAQPNMKRTLRKLVVPDTVMLVYAGRKTNSQNTMQKVADNEYTGQFGDLKESVSFRVQAEDYATSRRYLEVVDPPALEKLVREERRPAYLYYRPTGDGGLAQLRGRKQPFEPVSVSVQAGQVARLDVPAGTDVELTATSTKPLQSVHVQPRKAGVVLKAGATEQLDERTFRTRFADVRQEQNFVFEFTDTDGVTGVQQVLIKTVEDQAPRVKEFTPDDVIRKTKEGYVVTVSARVPFKGMVEDEQGLAAVRYAYSVARMDALAQVNVRTLFMAGAIPLQAGGGQNLLASTTYLAAAQKDAERRVQTAGGAPRVEHFNLPAFAQLLAERRIKHEQPELRPEVLPLPTVRELLAHKQREPYRTLLRTFALRPDTWNNAEMDRVDCDLPLWKAGLRVTDPRRPQPRYRVDIWLEAVDTDVDSERNKDGSPRPHLSPSGEKFTFLVVSEAELLTEVAKEEELKYVELDNVFTQLVENESRLAKAYLDLSDARIKVEALLPVSARCEKIVEELEKAQRETKGVFAAYDRILRELKTNQVRKEMVERVETKIVVPLREIDTVEFDRTRDALLNFRRALDNGEAPAQARIAAARTAGTLAKAQMQRLKDKLYGVLGAMQGLTDVNKLIKVVREIEEQEQRQFEMIKKLETELIEKLLEGGGEAPKKDGGQAKEPDRK